MKRNIAFIAIILSLMFGGYAYADSTPKDFSNINELKNFLRSDNTDQLRYIPDKFDCEDFADTLRDNAAAQGWRLETEFLTKAEVEKYFGWTPTTEYHVVNKAIIGNIWYWIEPMWEYGLRQVDRLDSMNSYQYRVGE